MVHVICLTKSYNYLDFKDWFRWYIKLGCFIHIIDNESSIPIFNFVSNYLKLGMPYHNDVNLNVTYDKIEGWPNQYKLYEEIMKDVRRHPKQYLAQKKFESQLIFDENGEGFHVCLGSYTVDGKQSGFYARVSRNPRIDSSAADIPVIIEK